MTDRGDILRGAAALPLAPLASLRLRHSRHPWSRALAAAPQSLELERFVFAVRFGCAS